ncbi:MAG: 23S rRNA pseudouridine955/2504/2580 synthase [Lentisphaeria bacterium]|jgi:23S rRNA pseudouridine955/2504/2580 synthase
MSDSVQFLTVAQDEAGQRLDNYLIRNLRKVPKSLIYRIIRKGEVRINKGRAKPERKLQEGDVVRVPPVRVGDVNEIPKVSTGLADVLTCAVVYESSKLIILNKPSGLAVHGGSGVNLGMVEALRQIRSDCHYLELVHRLDRDTSGCIMVAKKRSMLRELHALLRAEGGIDKRYLALVRGRWPSDLGRVDAPLRKNELLSGERVVRVTSDGKPSVTQFSIVKRFQNATLVQAKPLTGRTHQIRVHALHAGHPIVGDDKYGDEELNKNMKHLGLKRLFLHATSLAFKLENGELIQAEAPLPNDLSRGLEKLVAL